jgi:hypothetical protein
MNFSSLPLLGIYYNIIVYLFIHFLPVSFTFMIIIILYMSYLILIFYHTLLIPGLFNWIPLGLFTPVRHWQGPRKNCLQGSLRENVLSIASFHLEANSGAMDCSRGSPPTREVSSPGIGRRVWAMKCTRWTSRRLFLSTSQAITGDRGGSENSTPHSNLWHIYTP